MTELLVMADDVREQHIQNKRYIEYFKKEAEERSVKRARTEKHDAEKKSVAAMEIDEAETKTEAQKKIDEAEQKTEGEQKIDEAQAKTKKAKTDKYWTLFKKVQTWEQANHSRFQRVADELASLKNNMKDEWMRQEDEKNLANLVETPDGASDGWIDVVAPDALAQKCSLGERPGASSSS